MIQIEIKSVGKNNDTKEKEVTCVISNPAIRFLNEAVATYMQSGNPDKDDLAKNTLIREVKHDIMACKDELNPS